MRFGMKYTICAALSIAFAVAGTYAQDDDAVSRGRALGALGSVDNDASAQGIGHDRILEVDAIEEESRIMAKVLEESIDNADIGAWDSGPNWNFYTPFESAWSGAGHVRARYIPTVGAVFTLPVAFPIRSTARYSEREDEDEDEASDLWNKHQRSSTNFTIESKRPITVITDKDGRKSIQIREGVVVEERRDEFKRDNDSKGAGAQPQGANAAAGGFGGGGGIAGGGGGGGGVARGSGGGIVGGFGGGIAGGGYGGNFKMSTPEYEPEKVEKLRSTLLQTVAHYGHRMEHLPPDEHIIVIVESGIHGFLGQVAVVGQLFDNKPGDASDFIPFGRSTARYQIAVQKRVLEKATSEEDLEGKVEETEY